MSGTNAELRERLASVLAGREGYNYEYLPNVDEYQMDRREFLGHADAILAEIAASGLVLVDGERFERLRWAAMSHYVDQAEVYAAYAHTTGRLNPWNRAGLQPGDLDPIERAS